MYGEVSLTVAIEIERSQSNRAGHRRLENSGTDGVAFINDEARASTFKEINFNDASDSGGDAQAL